MHSTGTKSDAIYNRIILLSRGIRPPVVNNKYLNSFFGIGVGAGPQGKSFHILNSNDTPTGKMISLPVYSPNHHLSKFALATTLSDIPGVLITENGLKLKSMSLPNYTTHTVSDKSPLHQYYMIHCYNTCAAVLGSGCRHFETQKECIYCQITPIGQLLNLPKKREIFMFAEALAKAVALNKLRSITLTTGTFDDPDDVALYYIKLLKVLREATPVSIHIQHEPLHNLKLYETLSLYAHSTGIFLEILNEDIRKLVCPGKYDADITTYKANWIKAVDCFGRGNVLNTCLLGFNVDYNEILEKIDEYALMGVRTSIMLVRPYSEKLNNFIPDYIGKPIDSLVDLFINASKIMQRHKIGFSFNGGSGCIGCQGCTAMIEADEFIKNN